MHDSDDASGESPEARRRLLHGALACGLWLLAGHSLAAGEQPGTDAAGFELVTAAEARREARAARAAPPPAPPVPRTRGVPAPAGGLMPAIAVIAPDGEAPVLSPLRLEVVFKPAADARIVPDSFRVLYGVLKIDLTDRLQAHARLSEDGMVVERAQMPQGTHRLLLRVADDKGRTAEQTVVFRVARRN